MVKTHNPGGRHVRQAVGSAEAAALLGIHWSMPSKLAARGKLSASAPAESAWSDDPSRSYAVYDGEECDRDYAEYERKVAARGGKSDRRPRAWIHMRPAVLKHLAGVKTPIAFDDAIGAGEAAAILGVHVTFVPRMILSGKIVGRRPWNPRSPASKIWIISRKSCVQNARDVRRLEAEGKKQGRPRRSKKAS